MDDLPPARGVPNAAERRVVQGVVHPIAEFDGRHQRVPRADGIAGGGGAIRRRAAHRHGRAGGGAAMQIASRSATKKSIVPVLGERQLFQRTGLRAMPAMRWQPRVTLPFVPSAQASSIPRSMSAAHPLPAVHEPLEEHSTRRRRGIRTVFGIAAT